MKPNLSLALLLLCLLAGRPAIGADEATIRICQSALVQLVNGLKKPQYIEIPLDPALVAQLLPTHLPAQSPQGGWFAKLVFGRTKFFHRINNNLDAGKTVAIRSEQDLAKIFKPGREYTFVLTDDRLIATETGPSATKDLVSKHIALADVDKPVRFAGILRFDEAGALHLVLRNESGTFRTPAALLPAAKTLLEGEIPGLQVKLQVVSQPNRKPLTPAEAFEQEIKSLHDFDYQQTEWKNVDQASDIALLRLMRKARNVHGDDKAYKEWTKGYRDLNADRAGGQNATEGFQIGRERPLAVPDLLNAIHGVINEFPELAPHFSELPNWSTEARIYLRGKFGIPPAKLLMALAVGRTRQYMTTGLEAKLEEAILGYPDNSVQIHDLFREAYRLAEGDVTKALLAAENVLTKDNWLGPRGNPLRGKSLVYQKFAYIRNDSAPNGDNYGAWYHFFGMALYATDHSWLKARAVGEVESFMSRRLSPVDHQEEAINRLGADFGAGLRKMVNHRTYRRPLPAGAPTDYMKLAEFSGAHSPKAPEAPKKVRVLGEDRNKLITMTFWHGMNLGTWLKLWKEHGFRISRDRFATAASITAAGMVNTALSAVDNVLYARGVQNSKLKEDPIFILGHWRSGTTLLHELMVLDDNHIFPNCYQCAVPTHFLLTEKLAMKLTGDKAIRRPMDNMVIRPSSPQEDEFGLVNMGAKSPYRQLAFGNIGAEHMPELTLKGLSDGERKEWAQQLTLFFKRVAYGKSGTLVVKSPTHTARVEELRGLFPTAKFIHISRDPYKLFASTMNLWQKFMEAQGVDVPKELPNLKDYVFDVMDAMYAEYYKASAGLPKDQLIELKYEDLVKDPVPALQKVYDQLGLKDFDKVVPKIQALQKDRADYQTNKFELDAETKTKIRQRWAHYFTHFGYE